MKATANAFRTDLSLPDYELTSVEIELLNSPQTSRRVKRYLGQSTPAAPQYSSTS